MELFLSSVRWKWSYILAGVSLPTLISLAACMISCSRNAVLFEFGTTNKDLGKSSRQHNLSINSNNKDTDKSSPTGGDVNSHASNRLSADLISLLWDDSNWGESGLLRDECSGRQLYTRLHLFDKEALRNLYDFVVCFANSATWKNKAGAIKQL